MDLEYLKLKQPAAHSYLRKLGLKRQIFAVFKTKMFEK